MATNLKQTNPARNVPLGLIVFDEDTGDLDPNASSGRPAAIWFWGHATDWRFVDHGPFASENEAEADLNSWLAQRGWGAD